MASKKRGRPKTTGMGQLIGVRLVGDRLAALDAWIALQLQPRPSRPEAIRRLVEQALGATSKVPARMSSAKRAVGAVRAEAQAGAEIDRQQRGSGQTEGEKASRKRRLLKGSPDLERPADRKPSVKSIPVGKLTSQNDT